jgi:hypothetical protein
MKLKLLLCFAFLFIFFHSWAYPAEDKPILHLPFPEGEYLTCSQPNFGSFSHSFSTTKYALDFGAAVGTPLVAMASGIAYVYDEPSGYGYESYGGFGCHVKIDHGDGYYTIYGHMRSFTVANEQFIGVGEQIGTSGGDGSYTHICNGYTSGAHIHISLHQGDASSSHHSKSVSSKIFAANSENAKAYLISSTFFSSGYSYWSDNIPVDISDYFTCDTYGCYVCSSPCWGGGQELPDLIVVQTWLEDNTEKEKLIFSPGEQIYMKSQFKNAGAGDPNHDIEVKFYLSDGEYVDSNKQHVGTDNIHDYNLESRETHTETESIYAPTTPGTYNITACVDTGDDVAEEHESNNCSTEAVFTVQTLGQQVIKWLLPILNLILQ